MSRLKNIINSWREKHKLSYTNDETFFVKWSFNVSMLNILTLVILYSIILGFAVYLLILYTPLKKVVFDDISVYELNEMAENNAKYLSKLEEEINSKDHYISDLHKILKGEDFEDTLSQRDIDTLEGIVKVEFESSKADSILRKKIESSQFEKPVEDKSSGDPGFFMNPVKGKVSQSLDTEKKHFGVDVVTLPDEPIKATLEGQVIFSQWTNRQGHVIIIQHSNEMLSVYKHCSVLLKKEGEYVEAGDPIAIVGNTGELTDGPHLHFEIWQNGIALNPQEFISF